MGKIKKEGRMEGRKNRNREGSKGGRKQEREEEDNIISTQCVSSHHPKIKDFLKKYDDHHVGIFLRNTSHLS